MSGSCSARCSTTSTASLPWLTTLPADMWDNGVFLMLNGLSNEHAVRLLRDNPSERSMLLALLSEVQVLAGDDDLVADAQVLQGGIVRLGRV